MNMPHPNRPRIKLVLTPTDKFLETIGWGILLAMWVLVILTYAELPDIIPVHYNASGQINRYGAKSMIWWLPLIASILYVAMSFLNKVPHIFNYPTIITQENALRQYTTATKMVRCIKLLTVLIIGYLVFKTILIANGKAVGLGVLLPFFLGLLFVTTAYFITQLIIKK